MFDRSDHHFPVKRLLLLGVLVGAGAYYFSREQNRKALDQKLAELGLKDAAGEVSESVTKGWEKTKDAATQAGQVIAEGRRREGRGAAGRRTGRTEPGQGGRGRR